MKVKRGIEFKDNRLYRGTKRTGYEVVLESSYVEMYRVKYPDGELSADMYNRTRAKEHCYRLFLNLKKYDDYEGKDSF